jgi:hypothetical protein
MIHDLTIAAIADRVSLIGCRMAYDCWPWEWRTVVRDHICWRPRPFWHQRTNTWR